MTSDIGVSRRLWCRAQQEEIQSESLVHLFDLIIALRMTSEREDASHRLESSLHRQRKNLSICRMCTELFFVFVIQLIHVRANGTPAYCSIVSPKRSSTVQNFFVKVENRLFSILGKVSFWSSRQSLI